MYLKNIEIKNFRNIKEASLSFSENTNIILGKNAQGKTNLLEAIYLLSGNKSFRGSQDRELFAFEETNFFVGGRFCDGDEDITLKVGESLGNTITKKVSRGEKVYKSTRSLLGAAVMTVFSPDDLELIKGGPVLRRNYCDILLASLFPAYAKTLSRYNRILSQKNACIREENYDFLDIWNSQLAVYGASVIKSRTELLKRLIPHAQKCFFDMAGENEILSIEYLSSFECDIEKNEKDISLELLKKIKENYQKEISAGAALYGPHRDDLDIKINNYSARQFASQGQQRSAVLALLLAKTELIRKETKKTPIVLLDDVMSELDDTRRSYLTEKIRDFQVFITCCQDELYKSEKNIKTFWVEKGKIIEKEN